MHYADLSTECQVGQGADIRAVGWLGRGIPYRIGAVPASFLTLLQQHVQHAWQPVMTLGYHACEFCNRDPFMESSNVWIPTANLLYIAPGMITHYIETHEYRPPDEFISAVIACPTQGTKAFITAMRPYQHYYGAWEEPWP